MDESSPRNGRTMFACLVGVSQVLGLASVVLTGVWLGQYRGGFAWDASPQEFNLHPLCMVLGLVFLQGDGFVAVFDVHRASKIPDMYSLHSWCGMATFILFCVQWVVGLMFFLFPVTSSWLRAAYLPIHVFCGLVLLVMCIGSCLTGITEKLLFTIAPTYSLFASEGVMANVLGILLVGYGVLLVYLVTKEEYRRPPNPEEESLSVHFKTLTEGESPTSP
ncbi:transmembrane ascorbate-dependent reductase CYB561 isoform X2 [Gouania willdenowi]|uniref:transmembrane ascorbate-dependent reductase CYB561 isoform X2 n=1 Tax=Gouania willdenowi TaxID=441366 RepID=UPI001056593E|nr:cytochrome b561 isoform X2 [Gouania willdenowi]